MKLKCKLGKHRWIETNKWRICQECYEVRIPAKSITRPQIASD